MQMNTILKEQSLKSERKSNFGEKRKGNLYGLIAHNKIYNMHL